MAPQLDAFGVVVDDMAKSLAFYRQLGLDIPADAEKEGHVDVTLPGGTRLMFDTVEVVTSFAPEWKAEARNARISLAFRCDSPAEVDAAYERIVGLGYHGAKEPWDAFWGQRYALLHDPDGNEVDLFAAL